MAGHNSNIRRYLRLDIVAQMGGGACGVCSEPLVEGGWDIAKKTTAPRFFYDTVMPVCRLCLALLPPELHRPPVPEPKAPPWVVSNREMKRRREADPPA